MNTVLLKTFKIAIKSKTNHLRFQLSKMPNIVWKYCKIIWDLRSFAEFYYNRVWFEILTGGTGGIARLLISDCGREINGEFPAPETDIELDESVDMDEPAEVVEEVEAELDTVITLLPSALAIALLKTVLSKFPEESIVLEEDRFERFEIKLNSALPLMAEKLFIATVLLHSLPLVNLTGVVLRDSSKTEFSKLIRSSSDMAPASFAAIAAVSGVRELNRGNSEIVAQKSLSDKGFTCIFCESWDSFQRKFYANPLTVVFVGLDDGGKSEEEFCTAAVVVVADDYGIPLDLY
uniref:Uncharacterized protein n=1 Tax=Glossina palpalis gambiensis TaxID=67801 RepID=A0A1B0C409_9MUSC